VDNERVIFLVIGVVVVVAVGRLLAMSGRRYLTNAAPSERQSSGSAATLVAVLFHLMTLGVVALLAVVPLGGSASEGLLLRLGILLIALAVIFGVTIMLLGQRRQEALAAEIETGHLIEDDPRSHIRVTPVEHERVELWHEPTDTPLQQPHQDRSY
jgi:protein-S-isoprenylcysteine O-methyltransferase Ste14